MTTPADPQGPMSYYSVIPNQRPTSVTVVAILGIILASMGILCSPFAVIPYVVNVGPPNPAIEVIKGSTANMAFLLGTLAIGFLNAILLLASSIASLKLRPWGRKGLLVYAGVAILSVVAGLIFNCLVLFPALAAASSTSPAGAGALVGGIAGGVGGAIFGMALPVVIIIVMSRPNVVAAFQPAGPTGQ